MQHDYDIVIVGGALVGASLSLALNRFGYRVALVDARDLRSDFHSADTGNNLPDLRTTAIAAATVTVLQQLSLWPAISGNAAAIEHIQVSQQGYFGTVRLSAHEEGVQALGYVISNDACTAQLYQLMARQSAIEVIAPAAIKQLHTDTDSVHLGVQFDGNYRAVTSRLLVAVDGANSMVRVLSGIETLETDYSQQAIVASIRSELPNRQTAYERFTPSGPLAMLPVQPHVSSLVYTVDDAAARSLMELPEADFLCRIQSEFGSRLGRLLQCGARSTFPLILREAKQQSANRVLLLGNAARTLHPVAGQGFNLAIRDIGKLLELLGMNSAENDPGLPAVLREFCSIRQADQRVTVAATDALVRIFRGNNRCVSLCRAAGLIGLDSVPLVRRRFVRTAMGYGTSLPDLRR